jgi:hypothetical protein
MSVRSSIVARKAALQALANMVDAAASPGTISIYGGVQPDSADEGVGNRPLLATLAFSKPAFGPPGNTAIGARPISDGEAIASGRATWARISDGAGNTLLDADVGELGTGAMLTLSALALERGDVVRVAALVLRMPAG